MKKLIVSALICSALFGAAQNPGSGDFSSLSSSGEVNVYISKGDSCSVRVECENKEDLEKIKTVITNGELVVSGKAGNEEKCKVFVVMKEIKKLEATGASGIRSEGSLNVGDIDLTASGASKIKLKLNAIGTVKINSIGASEISLSGTGNAVIGDVAGASTFKAGEFEVNDVTVTATGSSTVKVMPKNSLKADASGASVIKYTVEPKNINANVTGAAEVKRAGDSGSSHTNNKDSNHVEFKGTKFKYRPGQNFHHWAGLDLGVSAYGDKQFGFGVSDTNRSLELNYGRSIHLGLNIGEKDFHIYKNYVNLVVGLGFEWNSYSFRHPITLNPDSTFTNTFTDSGISYNRNKLRTASVTMPLLLEFNTHKKNRRSFHLAAGVILNYNFRAKVLKEFEQNGYDFSVNRTDDFNINPFRYSATVRAGYGDVTIFANYALTTLFETNKGPELFPFSVGIRLIPF